MSRTHRWLIGLNAALLLSLVAVTLVPAQPLTPAAQSRARGQYVALPAKQLGNPIGVVYVMDTVNEELIALRWDRAAQRLELGGFRDMINDAGTAGKGR